MQVLYVNDHPYAHPTAPSIFLVGPTPRNGVVPSWRPAALKILERLKFPGVVFVPERKDWSVRFDYTHQTEWEFSALSQAAKIVAWVPRDLQYMLALTTNVEFGYWLATKPDSMLYGRPPEAAHIRYLDWMYHKLTGRTAIDNLEELLRDAVYRLLHTDQINDHCRYQHGWPGTWFCTCPKCGQETIALYDKLNLEDGCKYCEPEWFSYNNPVDTRQPPLKPKPPKINLGPTPKRETPRVMKEIAALQDPIMEEKIKELLVKQSQAVADYANGSVKVLGYLTGELIKQIKDSMPKPDPAALKSWIKDMMDKKSS